MDFFPELFDIDMRERMHAVLFGDISITAQGRPVIVRRISDIRCVCWVNSESGPNRDCAYCKGEGYQFSETAETMVLIRGAAPIYKPGFLQSGQYPMSSYGYTDMNRATGYCEYTVFPDYERYTLQTHKSYDFIYELKVQDDGSVVYPYIPSGKWKMVNLTPIHGDHGRVEFFELSLEKSNVD